MAEPVRKSMYDILESTLKLAGRKTFLHRYIYMGEHKRIPDHEDLETLIRRIVKQVNSEYCDEPFTGIMLLYNNYFVHIADGAGDSIIKHAVMLMKEGEPILGQVKLLATYHHLNQKFFDTWDCRHAVPPTLLERIDEAADFEETKRYLSMCIKKIYNLAIHLRQVVEDETGRHVGMGEITSDLNEFLPEYALLDFLLNSPYPKDMRNLVFKIFNTVPAVTYYTEKIWPVRGDFVPYDVFDKEKNPVESLPTKQEKQKFNL